MHVTHSDQFIAFDPPKFYILVNNLGDKLVNRPGSVCIGQSYDNGRLYRKSGAKESWVLLHVKTFVLGSCLNIVSFNK